MQMGAWVAMQDSPDILHPDRLVPSGGLIHLIRMLDRDGVDTSILKEILPTDFSKITEQNARIEVGKIAEVYRLAMTLPLAADFWLRLGDSFSVHNYHLELSNWILTGKNFAEIMPKLHGLYGSGSTDPVEEGALGTITESEEGDQVWLRQLLAPTELPPPFFKAKAELSAASLVRGLTSLLGNQNLQFRFYFDYAEPAYGDRYREILGPDVTFNAPQTEVHVPRDYIYQQFLSSDAVMHQFYEKQLPEFFNSTDQDNHIVARIEAILLESHCSFPTMIQVCDSLNMGERALRRSLQKCGTSYRQVLRDTKMKRAKYYLQHTDISIEEIAYRLDYSDYANFRRAFQAKYAETPSSFRRHAS